MKRRVLLQISVINTMLAIETEKEYGQDYLERFIKLAAKVDGIGFIPDGTLLDLDGRVIVYPDGRSDAADFSPRACTRKIRGEDRSTPEGAERKQRNLAYLKEKQIPYLEHLPELPPLSELKVKSREEIARRAAALLIVIQYACDVAQESDLAESKAFVTGLLDQFGVADELTELERDLLEQAEPARQAAVNLTWQYEAYWALLWALGMVDSLDFPDHTCDCDLRFRRFPAVTVLPSFWSGRRCAGRKRFGRGRQNLPAALGLRQRPDSRPGARGRPERKRRDGAAPGAVWMIGYRDEAWDDISMDT
ncbi:hypothetical protein HMSSN036_79860 [Paenibacillus macerans]|nr:hypothetical protein HMSSN036_79860 [Paenibacillus macerans]